MLKRVIMLLTLRDGVLVRTKRFVPDYIYTQSYLDTEAVDEVVIVDVGTDGEAFCKAAKGYADRCFTPICVGGHITDTERLRFLAEELGADKFLIRWDHPTVLEAVAALYGSQAAVAGIDLGRNTTDPVWAARQAVDHGAGELLLTDADRDGSLQGYNLEMLRKVLAAVTVPVIVAGGCGGWHAMAEAFRLGASGAATSVIHHFTATAMGGFKASLKASGVEVRV